jgi:hypothetical protein
MLRPVPLLEPTPVAAPEAPSPPTGGGQFASGKGPNTAWVTVTRGGETIYEGARYSGNMTAEEKALGFPRSSLATHTEARFLRDPPVPLQAGDNVNFQGVLAPCPYCKGVMNAAAQQLDISIDYSWADATWSTGGE